jgi:hypothetical protein
VKYLIFLTFFAFFSCRDDKGVDNESDFLDNYEVVAAYGFNNNFEDNTSNEIDLISTDVEFVNDRDDNENSAVSFNGNSSFLRNNYTNILDLSPQFTLSVWVKPDLANCKGDQLDYIDVVGRWFATGRLQGSYSICLLKNGTIEGRTYDYEMSHSNTWIPTEDKVIDNEWNNIIITRNETGILLIYLNGELVANGFVNPPQVSEYELYIGKRSDNRSIYAGAIDDVLIIDEFVAEKDIKKLMDYSID